jgi:cobalt-zinc-cadmium efflux system protein
MPARSRLALAFVLSALVAALEFAGGALSHSLALTTDAVHVCMDVFGLGIALAAAIGATRRANRRKTFGYGRLEVLGALINGSLLLGASGVIAYEAIVRLREPVHPHGVLMTAFAAVGLLANLTAAAFLRERGHHHHHAGHVHDLNVRAAMVHVAGDALASLSVVVGGLIIAWTGVTWLDPVLSLFVAAIVVVGVAGVIRDAGDVLLEGSPPGIDVGDVERQIESIPGVSAVHDLHVWSIGSSSPALSAHLLLDEGRLLEGPRILAQLRDGVRSRYGIDHVTIQLESEHCDPGGIVICRPDP